MVIRVAGLGINGGLTPALVPTVTFEPTLGIAAARIDKMSVDIRSFREPLMQSIREVMVPSIRRNFDQGGRPGWEALSDSTVKLRAKAGFGPKPILVRSGALRRGASQINIWDVTTTSAVIRDLPQKVWYGKVQQAGYEGQSMTALIKKHGGDVEAAMQAHTDSLLDALSGNKSLKSQSRTSPSIPARPFLVYQEEDIDAIHVIFDKWLGARFDAAWPP